MSKLMEYPILVLLILTTTLSSLMACTKQNLPVKPAPSQFSATLENMTEFPSTGGTTNIVVNAGTNGWWVTMPTNNWCVITKLYGSGDFKIPVTVRANTTGVKREINVTVHPTFDLEPIVIKIAQSN